MPIPRKAQSVAITIWWFGVGPAHLAHIVKVILDADTCKSALHPKNLSRRTVTIAVIAGVVCFLQEHDPHFVDPLPIHVQDLHLEVAPSE